MTVTLPERDFGVLLGLMWSQLELGHPDDTRQLRRIHRALADQLYPDEMVRELAKYFKIEACGTGF